MLRRDFILKLGAVAITGLPVAACTTSATTSTTPSDKLSQDKSRRREIDARVNAALARV